MRQLYLFMKLAVFFLASNQVEAFANTPISVRSQTLDQSSTLIRLSSCDEGGTFRAFAEYAWEKLLNSELGLSEDNIPVPKDLEKNTSEAKGPVPPGTKIDIEIKAAAPSDEESPLRLVRYALLETLTPSESGMKSIPQAIQVLNLVMFPNSKLPLPVLGMDLVTLPGNKNLIAIDFQPTAPPTDGEENYDNMFPSYLQKYEERLKELHERHVKNQQNLLPFGGEIPPQAKRFFSPYALWTRIQDDDNKSRDALSIIQTEVFKAYCEYFDLYLEMMTDLAVQKSSLDVEYDVKQGHVDYLNYRRDFDPARPMLTRLYGEDYAEEVISDVLFKEF